MRIKIAKKRSQILKDNYDNNKNKMLDYEMKVIKLRSTEHGWEIQGRSGTNQGVCFDTRRKKKVECHKPWLYPLSSTI